METIGTAVQLQSDFTNILYSVIDSVSIATTAIDDMGRSIEVCFDATAVRETEISIGRTTAAVQSLSGELDNMSAPLLENIQNQETFGDKMSAMAERVGGLMGQVKEKIKSCVSKENIEKVMDVSVDLAMSVSGLERINDGMQSTEELTNMVYRAAQDARCSFLEMSDAVAGFGGSMGDVFGSSEEVVAFAGLIQKQMTIDGAEPEEASNMMQRLSEAFASDSFSGDMLPGVLEQMPGVLESVAGYLNVPAERIGEMASEGMISADVLKAAVLANADEINAKFGEMPMTWEQALQSVKDSGLIALEPVAQKMNKFINSEAFQTFMDGAEKAMTVLSDIITGVLDVVESVGSFFVDHWSEIGPVVYGVIAALGAYLAVAGLVALINGAIAVSNGIKTAADSMAAGATFIHTAAQTGLNAALAACPLTWIILLIIALVAIIYAVCAAIAKATGIAGSGFGVIAGCVNVVLQFLKNLLLVSLNVTFGIWNAVAAVCGNIKTAFHNVLCGVQAYWYRLLSTCLTVIGLVCEALNKLPFVDFDYSFITSAAVTYAGKAADAAKDMEKFDSVGDAFQGGYDTFNTFGDGWASQAFEAGASWGDGVADAVGSFNMADLFGAAEMPGDDGSLSGFGESPDTGLGEDICRISDNTGTMADSVAVTQEDLKYLRDTAEQEGVNRYTLTEVNIDQSGMQNTIRNNDDLDGLVCGLTDAFMEAVEMTEEGVHV